MAEKVRKIYNVYGIGPFHVRSLIPLKIPLKPGADMQLDFFGIPSDTADVQVTPQGTIEVHRPNKDTRIKRNKNGEIVLATVQTGAVLRRGYQIK